MSKENIKIVEYKEEYKQAFKAINEEWLNEMFEVEDYDNEVLSHPQKYILNRKGNIWIALLKEEPVGTVALMELEDNQVELTKMGVTKKARGHGVGRKLLHYLVDEIFNTKENTYFLLTNSNCKAAIHLYEEFGFKHSDEIRMKYGGHYNRCDVGMIYKPLI